MAHERPPRRSSGARRDRRRRPGRRSSRLAAPLDPLTSRWRLVDGRRVHERGSEGAAPTFVLVHGLGVSGRYFLPLARRLALSGRVLVPDLPGNGRSEKPRRPLDVGGLADALAAWADEAETGAACVVGNSLGCQTVVRLAVARPDLVDRLVLVGPTIDPAARSFARQLARFVATGVREPPSLVALVLAEYLAAGPRRTLETARFALVDRIEERLPAVGAPTLVLRGEHDLLCPQPWAQRVVELLPAGRLAVIAGKAHAVHYSAADEVGRLVSQFAR